MTVSAPSTKVPILRRGAVDPRVLCVRVIRVPSFWKETVVFEVHGGPKQCERRVPVHITHDVLEDQHLFVARNQVPMRLDWTARRFGCQHLAVEGSGAAPCHQ